ANQAPRCFPSASLVSAAGIRVSLFPGPSDSAWFSSGVEGCQNLFWLLPSCCSGQGR
ncbi:LRRC59 isoform 3, partial [Pan troglodytes]